MDDSLPQRPFLRDDAVVAWCADGMLHLGDSDRAVRIGGVDPAILAWITALDGTRTLDECMAQAVTVGLDDRGARALLTALQYTGSLDDTSLTPTSFRAMAPDERLAVMPELYAAGHAYADARHAATAMDSRHRTRVGITGRGPKSVESLVGPLADLLRRSGVQATTDIPEDRLHEADLDLLVIASVGHPDLADDLGAHERGLPHLPVSVGATRAVVGPVVVPGLTPCLRCAALEASDSDASWPMLSVQLAQPRRRRQPVPALSSALAHAAASHAALLTLAWIDRGEGEAPLDSSAIQITLPGGHVRALARSAHPDCGCVTPRLRSA